MIYHIAETTSTNDLAREERYGHGDVICAERQTAGRGQRGHTWTSPEGVNLLFSVVLCPTFLPAGEQFLLSQAVALALVDTLGTCGIDARIKWTNDIYAGDRKLVGILIEHHLAGGRPARWPASASTSTRRSSIPRCPIPPRWRSKRDARSTEKRCSTGSTPHSCDGMPRSKRATGRRLRRSIAAACTGSTLRRPSGCPTEPVSRTPRRHVARLSFQGDRVRGEKIAGGVGNEKIRRIFVSPALQAAGIRDADHPAGQKAGTARPAQPAERPSGSHRCDGNG